MKTVLFIGWWEELTYYDGVFILVNFHSNLEKLRF